jgi:carboxypeptidase C (cathepsin A)
MTTAAARADEVPRMPGAEEAHHSNHYSGFLDLTSTRHMHYFYVESEASPVDDPIIFWTNGRPTAHVAFLRQSHMFNIYMLPTYLCLFAL